MALKRQRSDVLYARAEPKAGYSFSVSAAEDNLNQRGTVMGNSIPAKPPVAGPQPAPPLLNSLLLLLHFKL